MYVIYLQVSERVDATAFSPVSTQPEVQKKKKIPTRGSVRGNQKLGVFVFVIFFASRP